MNKIKVVGLGPGNTDYTLPKAKKVIKESDIIVGAKRNLESLKSLGVTGKETFQITSKLNEVVDFIKSNYQEKNIAVIVSGDTGFYSFLRYLKKHFSNEELEVIPGISSMQYMFSRIGRSWDRAYIGSLHGREIDFVSKVRKYDEVGLLTDKKWTPQRIASELLENGITDKVIHIGENLSYDNERITSLRPEEVVKSAEYDICVVVITDVC